MSKTTKEQRDTSTKELEAEVQRLREQTQWRPIETAPKDGETIIAVEQATASNKTFLGRRVVTSIYWEDYWKNSYSDGRVENGMWEVILWQPFPLPPQAQENEREALASKPYDNALARIAELEADVQKLQGVLRQLMATGLAVEALLADEPSSVYIHPGIWAKLKEHRGHLRRGLLMLRQERESE